MIDAHVHFWRYHPSDYPWISNEMPVLQQDKLPADYPGSATMPVNTVKGMIAVQARCDTAENAFLLDLASRHETIAGVVGWLDFCANNVSDCIEAYTEQPLMVGFRHLVQDEPNPSAFWANTAFNQGISVLQRHQMTYDILVKQQDLSAVTAFCAKHDSAWLVIDHLAKPQFDDKSAYDSWYRSMCELSTMPHVAVKLSGVALEAGKQSSAETIYPYWSDALQLFGAKRCLWGSDWPVSLLGHTYAQLLAFWQQFAKQLSCEESYWAQTASAATVYGLDKKYWEQQWI